MSSTEPVLPFDSEDLLNLARGQAPSEVLPAQSENQQLVERIISNQLSSVFAPLDEFPGEEPVVAFRLNPDVHSQAPLIGGGNVEMVSWDWIGIHVAPFRGVPATGRPVWIRAATAVLDIDGVTRFQHFVDWRRTLIQLGVAPEATRPIISSDDRARLQSWVNPNPAVH